MTRVKRDIIDVITNPWLYAQCRATPVPQELLSEGVYLLFNRQREIQYIGQSTRLISRIPAHFNAWDDIGLVYYISTDECPWERLNLEDNLIRKFTPPKNNINPKHTPRPIVSVL